MKWKIRLSLVRLIFIPIISFLCILALANGVRELLEPEWQILIDYPVLIPILSWFEYAGIVILSVLSIYCLVVLYYVLTKFVSTKEFEDALKELKKRE
jgi:hypothetical protein